MLGNGPIASRPIAGGSVRQQQMPPADKAALSISGLILPDSRLIIPERREAEGALIKSISGLWAEVVKLLGSDWTKAYEISSDKWEEIVAGAFKKEGYDEVILTPRSGDHGRDVIAIKRGIGCVKIIDSVKAYKPGNLVPYDSIRALLGVMSGEQDVSKGIITTTSDFPPKIASDPYIAPFLPTRLELMNGESLRRWLVELNQIKDSRTPNSH